jgi:hypothetical protein
MDSYDGTDTPGDAGDLPPWEIAYMEEAEERLFNNPDQVFAEFYIEFTFEDWPALRILTLRERTIMCDAIVARLKRIKCQAHAIKACALALYALIEISVENSVDEVAKAVESASQEALPHRVAAGWMDSYSAESVGPFEVVEAIVRIASMG